MEEPRKGTVVINEIKTKGLFKKYYQYGGGLKGAPGIYGYSLKQDLNKEYHRGEEVCVRCSIVKWMDTFFKYILLKPP